MSRNGSELPTTQKKDQVSFAGFFATPITYGNDMPPNVKFQYSGVRDFIDDFEGKVLYVKNVNQEKLKNKVLVDLNRLNREERMVQKLEEKLAKQGVEVNESSMIKKDLDDLQSLEQFSNNLKKASDSIQSKIQQCESHINQMKKDISDKRHSILSTNSRIMDISAQKEALSKRLRRIKRQQSPQRNSSLELENDNYLTSVPEHYHTDKKDDSVKFHKLNQSKSSQVMKNQANNSLPLIQSVENLKKLQGEGKLVKQYNEEIKAYILKKSNGFGEMKRMLQECFDQQRRRVLKQNKVSSSQNGLADSILFDMGSSEEAIKKSFFNAKGPKAIGSSISLSKLQDRELKNVMYDTIKQIKAAKILKEELEREKELLQQNKISYAQFRDFTPDQILALLMVRPEFLKQLLGIFDIKEKTLNLLIIKAKVLLQQAPNTAPEQVNMRQSWKEALMRSMDQ